MFRSRRRNTNNSNKIEEEEPIVQQSSVGDDDDKTTPQSTSEEENDSLTLPLRATKSNVASIEQQSGFLSTVLSDIRYSRVSWQTAVGVIIIANVWMTVWMKIGQDLFSNFIRGDTTPEYYLAYDQSFGFFDDIPNDEWRSYYQARARSAQHYKDPNDPLKHVENPSEWNYYNWDPYFHCPHVRKVGGLGGGSKWTCDAERLVRIARERPDQSCLVYSIGSRGNYLWELGLIEQWGGPLCEIHVFDFGSFDKDLTSKNIHYHQWGLGSSYSPKYRKRAIERGQKFVSFPETRRTLGHENRTIDLFKIDCEVCEWHTFKDWIDADLRQILIETHEMPWPNQEKDTVFGLLPALPVTTFFDTFKEKGFVLFSKEANSQSGFGRSVEWSFIKLRNDFLNSMND